jgi:sugar transferase (PEP-CTERM/EpsH1 system associated)
VKILLLTPQPPFPPHQGTAIRNWAILRHLATQHQVTLLTFGKSDVSTAAPEILALCESVHVVPQPARSKLTRVSDLLIGQADLAQRLWSTDFDQTLRRILTEGPFDIVQVEGLELGRYLPTVKQIAPATRIVYDAHNAEITLQQRAMASDRKSLGRWPAALYSKLQLRPLARFEAAVCGLADAVTAVSATDGATLAKLTPGLVPSLVPNGIDLDDYRATMTPAPHSASIVFTGKMDFRPNVDAALWFAQEIMPRVLASRPEAIFQIVGQAPTRQLLRLGERPGIVLTGAVPDTRPYIAGAAVYAAPLRMGGGTRFKLLEAMALARPIVSTRLGAEGFDVESGRELLLADGPEDLAAAVLQVLDDHQLAVRLGAAGRDFVKRSYAWDAILRRLDAVYAALRPAQQAAVTSEANG